MSLMLAASKPWVRNTLRAPSMIWRRLAVSAAAAVAPSETVKTSDIAFSPDCQRQAPVALQELVTEPFGQLDIRRVALYVKAEIDQTVRSKRWIFNGLGLKEGPGACFETANPRMDWL